MDKINAFISDMKINTFISDIKEIDSQISDLIYKYDNQRKSSLLQSNSSSKWILKDQFYIYKAMGKNEYIKLKQSFDFIRILDLENCFLPFEIVFEGNFLVIIRQELLQRFELLDNYNNILPIAEKEIKDKYNDINFFPYKNLSPYQYRFYLDYPENFYKLMKLIETFELRDVIEFSNCGFDKYNNIKCFDLEIKGKYQVKKVEDFIKNYSNLKDFSFPSFTFLIK